MEVTVEQLKIYITLVFGVLAVITVFILWHETRRAK